MPAVASTIMPAARASWIAAVPTPPLPLYAQDGFARARRGALKDRAVGRPMRNADGGALLERDQLGQRVHLRGFAHGEFRARAVGAGDRPDDVDALSRGDARYALSHSLDDAGRVGTRCVRQLRPSRVGALADIGCRPGSRRPRGRGRAPVPVPATDWGRPPPASRPARRIYGPRSPSRDLLWSSDPLILPQAGRLPARFRATRQFAMMGARGDAWTRHAPDR